MLYMKGEVQIHSFFVTRRRWVDNLTTRQVYCRGKIRRSRNFGEDKYFFLLAGQLFSESLIFFFLCNFSILFSLSWLSWFVHLSLLYNEQHKYPRTRRDLNPQSQLASSHKPTLQTAQPLVSAIEPRIPRCPAHILFTKPTRLFPLHNKGLYRK